MRVGDLGQMQVGFDGMAMPVTNPVLTIEAEHGPLQGAGITWADADGRLILTVEFQMRGQEPMHFHITEQDDGLFEVTQPPVYMVPERDPREEER